MFVIAITISLAPASVRAQTAWNVSYWDNATLSGAPVVTRQELSINHNWAAGSPDAQVSSDTFSARWTRTEQLAEGAYRFSATVDDGVRVWINGVRIIDAWEVGGARTVSADIYLTAGEYATRVEYFEANGAASIEFERTLIDGGAPGGNPPVGESPTPTPEPPNPPLGIAEWRAEYYNNISFSGIPDLVRGENNIDFTWGNGSPAPGIIDPDTFSARWTRTLNLDRGRYRFAVTVDDGVRLYVNDRLLIEEWRDQAPTTYTAEIELPAGPTTVRMDYYENTDRATARLSYAQVLSEPTPAPAVPIPPNGPWFGEYFDNVNLSGQALFVREDDAIDFDWGTGSPAPGRLGVDRFSVRWTNTLVLPPGRYRFAVTADDGVRLRVNDRTLIDEYTVQSATDYVVEATISSAQADVEMEYFENTGQAVARLAWTRVDNTILEPPPTAGQNRATVVGAANLNVRSGPGFSYDRVAVLGRAQMVELIGRNRAATWVQIVLPDDSFGWVNERYLNSAIALNRLPVTG
ncbi:MAG: PA14 domain-containing protein [Caldilineaceae bacterium]